MNGDNRPCQKYFDQICLTDIKCAACGIDQNAHANGCQECSIKYHLYCRNRNEFPQDGSKSKKENYEMKFYVIFGGGNQWGMNLYMASAMNPNIMLGNHAANSGGIKPVCAKVLVMVKNRIKTNAIKKPSAI